MTFLNKNIFDILKTILFAGCLLLIGLIINGLVGVFMSSSAHAVNLTEIAQKSTLTPEQITEALSEAKRLAQSLTANNMFVAPPPKPGPPKVSGVLGDEALVNNQWKKVGDEINGAKILSISPMLVVIEWQGQEMEIIPSSQGGRPSPSSRSVQEERKLPRNEKGKQRRQKKRLEKKTNQPQVVSDDLDWLDVPAGLKEKFRERWNSMSDEQKQQAKEQWSQMSQDEKDQAIDAWEQHL